VPMHQHEHPRVELTPGEVLRDEKPA
jgi:hypothetical protein